MTLWGVCCCRILDSYDKDAPLFRGGMDSQDSCTQMQTSTSGRGLPVYVMLPLDTVWLIQRDGKQVRTYVLIAAVKLQLVVMPVPSSAQKLG